MTLFARGSVFSPSNDRTTPNPITPPPAPRPIRPTFSAGCDAEPVLALLAGGGPFAATGGGPVALGVWTPNDMSGVCSPPIGLAKPSNKPDEGVVKESAPVALPPPCPPCIGVDCTELLWLCATIHEGVPGTFPAVMLKFTAGVPAEKGVQGKTFMGLRAPEVHPPASVAMLPTLPPCTVLLLQGASAVAPIVWLLPPAPLKHSCACASVCAISTSLKYSLSSSSAPS